jgi:hypothetical protein
MPQRTLRDAITQVARNCSLTNGVNMTPYSDETIASYLIAAHEHIMGEGEWSEMIVWRPRVLSGVDGLVTELITDCDDWKKVRRIYHELYQTPMPVLSSYVNPQFDSSMAQGYRGLAPEEDHQGNGKYLVKFYPWNLTGNVTFQYERTVDFTDDTTVLPIDWWLHVYYASWMFAADDGTNPVQIDKYMKLGEKRLKQINAAEHSRPTSHTPGSITPTMWWEDDAPYS